MKSFVKEFIDSLPMLMVTIFCAGIMGLMASGARILLGVEKNSSYIIEMGLLMVSGIIVFVFVIPLLAKIQGKITEMFFDR